MTPQGKKRLLQAAMAALLIGAWLFLSRQPEEPVWWLWLVPILLVLTIYQAALRGHRCPRCGQDFGLKETSRTRGGPLGGGRSHQVCVSCGEKQTQSVGIGH